MSKIVPFINILTIALCVIGAGAGEREASLSGTWVSVGSIAAWVR